MMESREQGSILPYSRTAHLKIQVIVGIIIGGESWIRSNETYRGMRRGSRHRRSTSLIVTLEEPTKANIVAFEEIMVLEYRAIGEGMRPVTYKTWFVESLLWLG